MLETAELGRKLTDEEFREQEPVLRVGLLTVQFELREADFPVVLVLAGNDGTSARDALNLLHEWMDPRYLEANVFEKPSDEELGRPRFWRYWRRLPARGRIGIFMREWTERAVLERASGEIDEATLAARLRHVVNFEQTLVDDGALVLKFWFHRSAKELKRQRKGLKESKEWGNTNRYVRRLLDPKSGVREVAERVLQQTSRADALWNIVES